MQPFTIGQDVTCVTRGHGRVENIFEDAPESVYVVFQAGHTATFTACGRERRTDFLPSLFPRHVDPKTYIEAVNSLGKPDPQSLQLDQPIYVLTRGCWLLRHFAKYENGVVFVWANGLTSYTSGTGAAGTAVTDWRLPSAKELQMARQRY